MYGERFFRRPKKDILEKDHRISSLFYQRWIKVILIRYKGRVSFCLNNHEICSEIYRLTFLHLQGLL